MAMHLAQRAPAESAGLLQRANSLSAALMRRRGTILALSLGALAGIALADLATGYELPLSLLYALPVVASTWAFGLRAGLALAVLATAAWAVTDALAEHHYSHAAYRYWEGFLRLATFTAFAAVIDQLKRALARSDDRLIKVLEGQDAAVCVIDPAAGSILYRNRAFDSQFPPESRRAAAQRLLEAALAPQGVDMSEELSLVDRWLLVRSRWLRWTDQRAVLLVSATDVTERRAAEALARAQHARLQATARLVAVGEIASAIAHELNQPLAAIATYVQGALRRLRQGRAEPTALAGALEHANEQAERAAQIIRRVRDFVRSRPPQLTAVDLNAVVRRAAAGASLEGGDGAAALDLELASSLPPARADALMLEQVILNLVRNAREAVRQVGSPGLPIEIATRRADHDLLEVSVADRGPGIPEDAATRLFDPFFTTKDDGLGLGLNICRSIVEYHGGHLWMQRRPGGGTQFHFTLHVAVSGA